MISNNLSEIISLDGTWDFRLGNQGDWNDIQVPGCWEAQKYSKYNEGPATYRYRLFIPESWRGKRIKAEFDAVSYAASFSLNQIPIGEHIGLWTPFELDITQAVQPGRENVLEAIIFKPGDRYPMRSCLAGFIPDVSTAFGGLWQSARLRAFQIGLDDLQIDTDVISGTICIRSQVHAWYSLVEPAWQVEIVTKGNVIAVEHSPCSPTGKLDLNLTVPGVQLWSPDQPSLYDVRVTLFSSGIPAAQVTGRTGYRRLEARGNQLFLNGEPFMVRGILSWGWEPDRITPNYSRDQVLDEIQRVKSMGFNLIKLCLFMPNKSYFDIADEEGMLLWVELPLWLPDVTPELRRQAPIEYTELARLAHLHPSVVLYSLGCELNKSVDQELLQQLNQSVRSQVSDVLVCDNSGSGESYGGLRFDFSDFTDYHPYYDLHYFEPLLDNWRRDWQNPRPWIFGEFCDSDTFRDLTPIIQANQGQRPWWLTEENPVTTWRSESKALLEVQDRLAQANLPFTPQEITRVSYAQTQVVRKFTLEALRRRSGVGGYIVTGLRDTPISTSGIWDDFGQPKWCALDFRKVNDDSVLCLDVGRRRHWFHGGDRPDRLDGHNFWSGDLAYWHIILHSIRMQFPSGSMLHWRLVDPLGGMIKQSSSETNWQTHAGVPVEVGTISCELPTVQKPLMLSLQVDLIGNGCQVSNAWPVWVYPTLSDLQPNLRIFDPTGVYDDAGSWLEKATRLSSCHELSNQAVVLATSWDKSLQVFLNRGGRVLLHQQGSEPFRSQRGPFWREAINLFHDHPLWQNFPHSGYTDLQFFGLASDTTLMSQGIPGSLPGLYDVKPILRRLDAREYWISDYLLEARLGQGILMVNTLRLQGGSGGQPFGWMRNVAGGALLRAMLDYLFQVK